jgi:hypothetical protein
MNPSYYLLIILDKRLAQNGLMFNAEKYALEKARQLF